MHNIEYYTYPEKSDKRKIYRDLNDYVEYETRHEGGSSLENIRWNDFVCSSYDDANDGIKNHDRGWYDQLAVKYMSPVEQKSKKLDELDSKIKEAYEVYAKRNAVVYPKTRKSEFIGCGNYKSRLATRHLTGNFCPVCRADLRPETTLESIAAAKNKWENAKDNRANYVNNHSKKEINWLVKIEYHT